MVLARVILIAKLFEMDERRKNYEYFNLERNFPLTLFPAAGRPRGWTRTLFRPDTLRRRAGSCRLVSDVRKNLGWTFSRQNRGLETVTVVNMGYPEL